MSKKLEGVCIDLCSRFIVNLPKEELDSFERIFFQIEQAHWFYLDFCREEDPSLPSMQLGGFAQALFKHCSFLKPYTHMLPELQARFQRYKHKVPVYGVIIVSDDRKHCLLVKGFAKNSKWSFPRGKINVNEDPLDCAIREVYEETGFDTRPYVDAQHFLDTTSNEKQVRLYIALDVPMSSLFQPQTRQEISDICWFPIADLPDSTARSNSKDFFMIIPLIARLRGFLAGLKRRRKNSAANSPAGKAGKGKGKAGKVGKAQAQAQAQHVQLMQAQAQQRQQAQQQAQAQQMQQMQMQQAQAQAQQRQQQRPPTVPTVQAAVQPPVQPAPLAQLPHAAMTLAEQRSSSVGEPARPWTGNPFLDFAFDRISIEHAMDVQ